MNQELYHPPVALEPSAALVAEWVGGELREGDKAPAALTGLGTLALAGPSEIAFISSDKFHAEAAQSPAGLLITTEKLDTPGRARIVVEWVWEAVAKLMQRLYPRPQPPAGVHPTAVVGEGVTLGAGVSVGAYCVIGNGCAIGDGSILGPHCILDAGVRIGQRTFLEARVTLMGPAIIGNDVIIHAGAVLGSDGFKFEPVRGGLLKIPQVGTVIIEDGADIGANTTIDRAFLYETRIGRGCKIDNLIQIGHNAKVGPMCVMASQVGIAGSSEIGAGCMLGGQVGIPDGIKIAPRTMLAGQTGVVGSIDTPGVYMGTPPVPIKQFMRTALAQAKLPDYARRLRALEEKLEKLEGGSKK